MYKDLPDKEKARRMHPLWRVCIYAACGALAGYYAFVLFLGKNPGVGTEYRMYYMDHLLSDWPGQGGLAYEPGTQLYGIGYSKYRKTDKPLCITKGQGWKNRETQTGGSENCSGEASMFFAFTQGLPQGGILKLNINGFKGDGKVSILFKHKRKDGTIEVKDIGEFVAVGEYEYLLPEVTQNDLTELIFKTEGSVFRLWTVEIDKA